MGGARPWRWGSGEEARRRLAELDVEWTQLLAAYPELRVWLRRGSRVGPERPMRRVPEHRGPHREGPSLRPLVH